MSAAVILKKNQRPTFSKKFVLFVPSDKKFFYLNT